MEDFLKYNPVYSSEQVHLIEQEFTRLKENTYLDHAGATLYSEKQLKNILSDLTTTLYANPHSLHISSKTTEDAVDVIRYQILQHFNTTNEEYSVIFTSGTTSALKIIAECFDYGENVPGTFAYLENNHTSVLGMRNFTENIAEIKTDQAFELLSRPLDVPSTEEDDSSNNIFVYPAECNFSGTKYPLDWIERVKNGVLNRVVKTKSRNWYVVLDAPGYVATNSLDLSRYKPDFVPISFYKIFGYPTGLGALLVRKLSEKLLKKTYFGGGTVAMVLSSRNVMVPRTTFHERFEDGTLPFLSIISVKHGFDTIKRLKLNFSAISKHTSSLAQYVYRNLVTLHHSNGEPVAILYHDTTFDDPDYQGGKVNFSLLRPNGDHVGYSEVLHMANLHGIHLRTGCHCNPGACQRFLKLKPTDVLKHFNSGHVCGDQNDLIDDYPTGTVRISFGYMSTIEDCNNFLKMIESCFVSSPIKRKMPENWDHLQQRFQKLFYNKKDMVVAETITKTIALEQTPREYQLNKTKSIRGTLQQIFLYPIKSCGAFEVSNSWLLTTKGLKYDRNWMIINSAGVCLTQKQNKKLCRLKPEINFQKNTLVLHFKGYEDIEVDLYHTTKQKEAYLCQSKICGDQVTGWDCGDEVSDWLSEALDMPGLRLLRQYEDDEVTNHQISFANKAQYLLLNTKSVEWLRNQVPIGSISENLSSTIQRFRPNFVVNFEEAFVENELKDFFVDHIPFETIGKCTRCQMICIDQETGDISKEPLLTLSREFKGKIHFGIYVNQTHAENESTVKVKCKVVNDNSNKVLL